MIFNDKVQLNYWVNASNFGDLLSPWLIKKMTNMDVEYNNGKDSERPAPLLAIGSIAKRATKGASVWGSGFFGDETKTKICAEANYLAVRGPLTRNLLRIHKISCPEIYGDPALLAPLFYSPPVSTKKYKLGVVLRWSERKWNKIEFGEGIKKIYLGSDLIEPVIDQFLECENILSSSLHGVIIADAYGIPSAWIDSHTPRGLNFKFYDYFLAVDKLQKPQKFDPQKELLHLRDLLPNYEFNDQKIKIDLKMLLDQFPIK